MYRSPILALLTAVTIAGPPPQRIFFTRVFPAPGELGLFIANADGTGEHPLLSPPDVDYDAAWSRTASGLRSHPSGMDRPTSTECIPMDPVSNA